MSAARADSIGSVGIGATNVAASGAETDRGLTANLVVLSYANGPFTAGVDSITFGKVKSNGDAYDGSRVRYSADYDFGFAKVGFGVEDNKGTSRDTTGGKQTTYGISAPFGAVRVGVIRAKSDETSGTATAVVKGTATGFAADYSFSKRTALNMSYAKIDRTDANATTSNEGKQYRVRLMHAF